MNVSTFNAHASYRSHQSRQARREPRITHERLTTMRNLETNMPPEGKSVRAWIEEQFNDFVSYIKVLAFRRSKNNCTTHGHRVLVDNARLGICKCAVCGASITSTAQIGRDLPTGHNSRHRANHSGYWVDESAVGRKNADRRKGTNWRV